MQLTNDRPTQTLTLCLLLGLAALGWPLASLAHQTLRAFTGL